MLESRSLQPSTTTAKRCPEVCRQAACTSANWLPNLHGFSMSEFRTTSRDAHPQMLQQHHGCMDECASNSLYLTVRAAQVPKVR